MSGIADGPPVLLAFEPWSVAEALVAEVQGETGMDGPRPTPCVDVDC